MRLFRLLATPPWQWLFALAAVALATSAVSSGALQSPAFCGALANVGFGDIPLVLGPDWSLAKTAAGWIIMVIGMMPPLLAQPVDDVWQGSLSHRRPWALLVFATAYLLLWLTAGAVLVPTAALLMLLLPGGIAAVAAFAAALLWSASPSGQAARNRCHRSERVGASGLAADRDCLLYGLRSGLRCAAACWPWMLATLCVELGGPGHSAVMAVVAALLFLERLAPPTAAIWQMPPAWQTLRTLLPAQNVLGSP